MRLIFLLLPLVLLFSCRDDARAQTGETMVGKVDTSHKLRQSPGDDASQDGALVLRMGDATVAEGQRVCLPVEANNFQDLIGFQFTMRFDSAALRYDTVRNFGLNGYNASNFGSRFAERGYLSTLWTDNNLKGVTKPDASTLFEVCFINLMKSGNETEVVFSDGPTTFEVVVSDMGKRTIAFANATVTCD